MTCVTLAAFSTTSGKTNLLQKSNTKTCKTITSRPSNKEGTREDFPGISQKMVLQFLLREVSDAPQDHHGYLLTCY